MNVHRFAIGQSVRLKGTIGMSLQTGDMFRITGKMPARNWSPQYRISSDEGRHERVAEENNLEEVTVAPSPGPLLARSESRGPKRHDRQENVHVRAREQRLDVESDGMRSKLLPGTFDIPAERLTEMQIPGRPASIFGLPHGRRSVQ
jgi:hypothetical protein